MDIGIEPANSSLAAAETPPKRYDVAVFLGSENDLPFLRDSKPATLHDVFANIGVEYSLHIASADRNPEDLSNFVRWSIHHGVKVFIGIAGMAAILPSAIAATCHYFNPVIGVPRGSEMFGFYDAVLSIFSKPPGSPVLLVNNPFNAALAACQILSIEDEKISERYFGYMVQLREKKPARFDIDPVASLAQGKAVPKTTEGE
jgi:5-(carboxyamino)imidazole ribonucleotide mutase